jgi:hypothetical protein
VQKSKHLSSVLFSSMTPLAMYVVDAGVVDAVAYSGTTYCREHGAASQLVEYVVAAAQLQHAVATGHTCGQEGFSCAANFAAQSITKLAASHECSQQEF